MEKNTGIFNGKKTHSEDLWSFLAWLVGNSLSVLNFSQSLGV